MDGLAIKPTVIQTNHGFLSIFFSAELHVDISNQMISQIITDVHLLDLSVLLFHFSEDLLKELIIMFLHLDIADSI